MEISKSLQERYDRMMSALRGKVSSNAKAEALERWGEKVRYCLEHVDESEFGNALLHNVEKYSRGLGGRTIDLRNRVMKNTQLALIIEVSGIVGLRHADFIEMMQPVDEKDTVLPGGKWLYEDYRFYVKENLHSYTVQFTVEKYGDELHDVLNVIQEMIADA